MLPSSQQLQEENKAADPGNGITFFKLLRIHPFDQLGMRERSSLPVPAMLRVRRGSQEHKDQRSTSDWDQIQASRFYSTSYKGLAASPGPPKGGDIRTTTLTFRWSHSRQEDRELF